MVPSCCSAAAGEKIAPSTPGSDTSSEVAGALASAGGEAGTPAIISSRTESTRNIVPLLGRVVDRLPGPQAVLGPDLVLRDVARLRLCGVKTDRGQLARGDALVLHGAVPVHEA